MRYPSRKKMKEMSEKLKDAKGTRHLKPDANPIERLKYDLCKRVVIFLHENRMTQAEFCHKFQLDPSRLSEIVHYRFDKYSIEKLFQIVRLFEPKVEIKVG